VASVGLRAWAVVAATTAGIVAGAALAGIVLTNRAAATRVRPLADRETFLAALAHELRTPLNALTGWLWWLRHGGLDAEQQERALETIERNAAALTRLIDDQLESFRTATGTPPVPTREPDSATVIPVAPPR
jgi:signal transduction histidine kinase